MINIVCTEFSGETESKGKATGMLYSVGHFYHKILRTDGGMLSSQQSPNDIISFCLTLFDPKWSMKFIVL
jgi:hypothetical protein